MDDGGTLTNAGGDLDHIGGGEDVARKEIKGTTRRDADIPMIRHLPVYFLINRIYKKLSSKLINHHVI